MGKDSKGIMQLKTQYKLIRLAVYSAIALGLVFAIPANVKRVKAENEGFIPYNQELRMDVTAYCLKGTTSTGCEVREGICAGSPDWYGLTAVIYDSDWEFVGYYEVKDTGGNEVRNGNTLDIWLPTYDECIEFGRKKDCHVFLINAKG